MGIRSLTQRAALALACAAVLLVARLAQRRSGPTTSSRPGRRTSTCAMDGVDDVPAPRARLQRVRDADRRADRAAGPRHRRDLPPQRDPRPARARRPRRRAAHPRAGARAARARARAPARPSPTSPSPPAIRGRARRGRRGRRRARRGAPAGDTLGRAAHGRGPRQADRGARAAAGRARAPQAEAARPRRARSPPRCWSTAACSSCARAGSATWPPRWAPARAPTSIPGRSGGRSASRRTRRGPPRATATSPRPRGWSRSRTR